MRCSERQSAPTILYTAVDGTERDGAGPPGGAMTMMSWHRDSRFRYTPR